MSISEIANRLRRNPSTIYQDIKRNRYTDTKMPEINGYRALVAQDTYEQRHAIHREMIRHSDTLHGPLDGSPVRSPGLVVVCGRVSAGRPNDSPETSIPKLSAAAADCRTVRCTRIAPPSACPRLLPASEIVAENPSRTGQRNRVSEHLLCLCFLKQAKNFFRRQSDVKLCCGRLCGQFHLGEPIRILC